MTHRNVIETIKRLIQGEIRGFDGNEVEDHCLKGCITEKYDI
jgi:hypothetical protein